jgi:hypothetical protein
MLRVLAVRHALALGRRNLAPSAFGAATLGKPDPTDRRERRGDETRHRLGWDPPQLAGQHRIARPDEGAAERARRLFQATAKFPQLRESKRRCQQVQFPLPQGAIHSVGLFNVREFFEVFFKPLPDEVKIFMVDIFGAS